MVHISQFYNCSKIQTGSELYLICEIGRYLKNKCMELSLDGVVLNSQLVKSKFWKYYSYSLSNNFIAVEPSRVDMPLYPDMDIDLSDFFTTDLSVEETSPAFVTQDAGLWHWSLSGHCLEDAKKNTKIMNGTFRSQAFVSLVALAMVTRFLTNAPTKFKLELQYSTTDQKASVADLLIIKDSTNALSDWFELVLPNGQQLLQQLLYEAWVYENLDMHYARHNATLSEKIAYFDANGYRAGDVVNLYSRNPKQRQSPYKDIEGCVIAIIESVTPTQITFKCVHTVKTKLGVKKQIEDYSEEVKKMYVGGSNKHPHISCESFHRLDIGLDRQTSLEDKFILPANLDDHVTLWVCRGEGDSYEEQQVTVDAKNGIYWILKDREVPFDEAHYKELYFKNERPLYDRYMDGEAIS